MHVSKRNLLAVHIWCSKHHNKGFFLLKNCKINLRLIHKDIRQKCLFPDEILSREKFLSISRFLLNAL